MNHIKQFEGLAKQRIRTSIVQKILKNISKGKVIPPQVIHLILLYSNYCCYDVSNYSVLVYSNIPRIREILGMKVASIKLQIGKQYQFQTETGNINIFIQGYKSRNQWSKKNNFGNLSQFFTPKFNDYKFNTSNFFSVRDLYRLQQESIIRIRYKSEKGIQCPYNLQSKPFNYALGEMKDGKLIHQAIQWVKNNHRLVFLPKSLEIFWNQNYLMIESSAKLIIWVKKSIRVSGFCWVKVNPLQMIEIEGGFINKIDLLQSDLIDI